MKLIVFCLCKELSLEYKQKLKQQRDIFALEKNVLVPGVWMM